MLTIQNLTKTYKGSNNGVKALTLSLSAGDSIYNSIIQPMKSQAIFHHKEKQVDLSLHNIIMTENPAL